MKKTFLLLALAQLALALLWAGKNTGTLQHGSLVVEDYVPNEVLVKFKPEAGKYAIQAGLDAVQGRVITHTKREITALEWDPDYIDFVSFPGDPYLVHVRVPESIGTDSAIAIFKMNPNVEYAERNGIMRLAIDPNDDHFNLLWGLKNTGQTGGTSDADIDAPEAWNIFTGSSNVIVAVIDSGMDYSHIDLSANIYINPGESGGGKETDGIDNDGNGKIDDWHGWDFYSGDNNPMDTYSHGTHVAGTIGAVGNNDEGVTGVCWTVKLMALRCGPGPGINLDCAINAIDYARAKGARVINASWGGTTYYSSLYDAIYRALTSGIVFCAAACNDNNNNDQNSRYPASYSLNNIIAVMATNHNDNKPGYSNYGAMSVDIAAPGGHADGTAKDIYSTVPGDTYQYKGGTSMATPHVAGVAALAIGRRSQLSYGQIRARIIEKRDYKSSLQGKCVANGRLNAYNVLYDASSPSAPTNLTAAPTAWQVITLSYTDTSGNEIGFEIQRKSAGQPDFSYLKSVDSNVTHPEDTTATLGVSQTYKVRSYNMAGVSSYSNTASATAQDGVPATPTNLWARNPSPMPVVRLTWTDVANNDQYYYVERKSNSLPQWTEIAGLGYNSSSYDDTDIMEGETYYYRVRCWNPRGYSSYSNTITVLIMSYPK